MVSMKLTDKEAKERSGVEPAKPGDGPRYPYGLCLYLDDASLAKLGITDLPEVGSTWNIVGKVVVTSVGMSQQLDGDKEKRTELQITDMEIELPARDAKKFFKSSDMAP